MKTLVPVFGICMLASLGGQTVEHGYIAKDTAVEDTSVFVIGEELTYNVSYAFFDIGQIRIKILDKVSTDGVRRFRAIAYIDSYCGIPFVNVHTIYESSFDGAIFSRWFRSRVKDDSRWYATTYEFDYPKQKMYFSKWWWGDSSVEIRDSVTLDTLYQDGLSLYFYARQHLHATRVDTVPTLVREEQARTIISFTNKPVGVEIDAVAYPVDGVAFHGDAEFVGVFGLTGSFQGWFSNDDARVPLLAKMKVILGNIRVELVKWHRPGWTPPQFVEKSSR